MATDENNLSTPEDWAAASKALREQNMAPQVANSLYNAATVNPVSAAQTNVQARALGIPPESAAAYPDDVTRQAKLKQFDPQSIVQQSPVLARFLTVQSTANAVHHDILNAQGIEQVVKQPPLAATVPPQAPTSWIDQGANMAGALGQWYSRSYNTAKNALAEGVHTLAKDVNLTVGAVPVAFDKLDNWVQNKPVKTDGTSDMPLSDWWFRNMVEPPAARAEANAQPANAPFDQKLIGSTAKLGLTLAEIYLSGGSSLEMQAATRAPTVSGILADATTHALKSMWLPATTSAIETGQKVYETTGDSAAALKAATAQYTATTGMGLVPLSAQGNLAFRTITGFGSGVASGEASRQGMNAVLPDSMQVPFSWEDTFLSGTTGSILGAVMGPRGNSPISTQIHDTAQAKIAEQDHAQITALSKLATDSQWRANDPDGFKEFVKAATEDGHLQSVYVKADTLAQSLDKAGITAEELQARMPDVAKQMTEALHTNGDVQISTEDYATHIAGSPIDADLLQHLKTDPAGKTYAEAQEFYKEQAAQMKEAANQFAAATEGSDQVRESQRAVQDTIQKQLDAVGRFPSDVNKTKATIQATILTRIAADQGILPEEALAKYGAQVTGESQTARGLAQSPAYGADERTGLPLNPDGTVTLYHHTSAAKAEQITKSSTLKADAEPDVYLTTHRATDTGYGDTAVAVRVDPAKLSLDDEFPDGRQDYRISVGKPGGSIKVKVGEHPDTFKQSTSSGLADANNLLADFDHATTIEAAAPKMSEKEIHDAEQLYLSNFPANTTTYRRSGGLLKRIRAASEVATHDIGDDPAKQRESNTALGPFSGYRVEGVALEPDSFNPNGKLEVHVYGKEQIEAGLTEEPALTFEVTPEGEITVNGPSPSGATYAEFAKRGWADLARDAKGEAQAGWSKLLSEKGTNGNLPISEVVPLIADVHARIKAWRMEDYVGMNWSRATGALGGLPGEFDPSNPSILAQKARGTYNPMDRTIALLKDANLSTYLHETGHWILDIYSKIALEDNAPPRIKEDMNALLKWFGVESLDKWHDMTLDEQREHHEQLARGFEAYLMEGKAPSQELVPVFQRIRAWMLDIYKSIRNLNVELTPEVRGVFDRMLASDEAIKQAQEARVFEPIFTSKPEGVSAEEWANYQALGESATNNAIDEMQSKSVRDMKWLSNAKSKALKELQREAKGERDKIEAEVAKQVEDMPVYKAEKWITKGEMTSPTGEEIKLEGDAKKGAKLNKDAIAEMYPEGELARPDLAKLRGMTSPDGIHPDMMAEIFGFQSGRELVNALMDRQPKEAVIEGLTDKRMLEEHGELSTPDAIEQAANEAVHNAARARFMATGLKILAKSPISARTLLNGAREAAEAAIAAKKVKELNPRQYLAAETRSNKEAIQLAPKDPAGAIKAQRAALLNNQLVKAAYEAQDLVRKAVAYAKSFDKTSKRLKISPEERDMIDGLLARFDFRQNPPNGPTKKQLQLEQWVASQKALGYTPAEIPDMLDPDVRMHYKEMTVEQLRGLMDTIRSVEKIGRERTTVTVEGQRLDVQEAVAPMIAKMQERGEKFTDAQLAEKTRYGVDPLWRVTLDRIQSVMRAGLSEVTRPDYKANKYDLHELMGPFQKAVSERLLKAAYDHGDLMDGISKLKRERVAEYKLDKEWQHTLDTVVDNHNLMDNSLETPSKRRLTRGDLIGMAMHVGNESNFDKLVRGMQWEPADVWKVLHDNMSEKDWLAAKTMGEMAGAKWDEMAAMNRRLGNDNPEKIEPRPFQTKFGEMPGWYSPVDYDPLRSKLGKKKAEANAINPAEGLFSRDYFRADTTTNGSLNSRASGYYDFVNLDWRPIEKRISDSMRDLAYREALIDVHKIYSNKEFSRQFMRTYGPEEYKHLGDWLGRLVNAEVGDEKQSLFTAISSSTRRALVANGVAFRISTMIKHGGSAGAKSMGYFAGGGEKYFLSRIASMSTNHATQVEEAIAKFPEIRQRARQQDRDFSKAVGTLFEPESLHGKAERFGHAGVSFLDFFTAVPTAHAAYDWAITEGIPKRLGGTGKPMNEADAIRFANKIVREAHGSTNEASQSLLINNKSEIVKALTTLHGFMNNAFGQNVDALDKMLHANGFGKPELLARMMMANIVPALMAGWVTYGGPNKEESYLTWAFHHIGGEMAGMLPMVREAWSAVVEGHASAGLPSWIRALTDVFRVGQDAAKIAKGETPKQPIKHLGNAAGLWLPGLGQFGSSTQFLYDVGTGEQHPETVGEWFRGVMSGKAKKNE